MIKLLTFALSLSLVLVAQASNNGSDQANNSTYTTPNSWADGQNGGSGFGAWTLKSDANGGSAGFFLADTGANPDLNGIATGNKAWGTFANGGGFQDAVAFRAFTGGSMSVSQVFSISMENGSIQNTGVAAAGFSLRTGNVTTSAADFNTGERFELYFLGGNSDYTIVDASGTSRDTGVPFTSGGLDFRFTLTGTDTYSFSITPVGGSATTLTGTLAGTSGSGLDSFALFNRDTESANVYFNSLSMIPEPSTWLAAGMTVAGCIYFRRRRAYKR